MRRVVGASVGGLYLAKPHYAHTLNKMGPFYANPQSKHTDTWLCVMVHGIMHKYIPLRGFTTIFLLMTTIIFLSVFAQNIGIISPFKVSKLHFSFY